jgi:hypothetical protein
MRDWYYQTMAFACRNLSRQTTWWQVSLWWSGCPGKSVKINHLKRHSKNKNHVHIHKIGASSISWCKIALKKLFNELLWCSLFVFRQPKSICFLCPIECKFEAKRNNFVLVHHPTIHSQIHLQPLSSCSQSQLLRAIHERSISTDFGKEA